MSTKLFSRTSTELVNVITDIEYAADEPHQPGHRQSLDLYLPSSPSQSTSQSTQLFPLLVYVHGGLWMDRDKNDYANIGHTWSKRGAAVAIVNYRQTSHGEPSKEQSLDQLYITPSQSVVHPRHTKDLATALSFLIHPDNASRHCYDSNRIMLIGHSCGAHMAGLVALHPSLMSHDLSSYVDLSRRIVGCVGIEGLYHMTKWCADFPDWRGDIDKVFLGPESEWLEPVNVPHTNNQSTTDGSFQVCQASWLLIHSSEDPWVNAAQHESMIEHLKSLRLESSLHSIKGGHFAVVDQIGADEDVITTRVFEFLHHTFE